MKSSATIGNIKYILNKDNNTASVYCVKMREIKDDFIIIPRSINYESIDYVVTKINKDAFSLNQILKYIQFSDDSEIQAIEENAFELSSIEQFIIPPSLTEFTTKSFFLATKLSKITVMPGNPIFTSIDDKMICKKSSIEKVDFDVLFLCVKNIEKVTIPSFIEIIGSCSFQSCCLQWIEFPPDSKLRIIEKNAFTSTRIKSIKIPPHLTKICEYAFSYCVCLCQVDIPNNSELQIIEKGAFSNCLSLEKFTVPPHLTTICENTFHSCSKLQEIVVPNNSELKTIEKKAFDSSLIKSITIPQSLVDLQDGWCYNAYKLTSVIVHDNNPRYTMYENKFILGKSSIENEDYDSLVFCFHDIQNNVKLPNFVKIIEPNAFQYCKLQSLEFPADSKLQMIKDGAFYGSLIESFSFVNKIKKICKETFFCCRKLRFVDIPKDSELQLIDVSAFYMSGVNYIFIPYQVTQICASCFAYSKLRRIDFADNSKLQIIGETAFYSSLINRIILPSQVTQICEGCFYYCKYLKEIEIPINSELRVIKRHAFDSTSIISFFIPAQLEEIDSSAFDKCNDLAIIEIDKNCRIDWFDRKNYEIFKKAIIMIPVKHINKLD